MNLALFQYVDDVLSLYKQRRALYVEVKDQLESFFEKTDLGDGIVSYPSRLKSEKSLRIFMLKKDTIRHPVHL